MSRLRLANTGSLQSLENRAKSLGLTAEIKTQRVAESEESFSFLNIELQNGRTTYRLPVFEEGAVEELMRTPLDKIVILNDYAAYYNQETNCVEALFNDTRPRGSSVLNRFFLPETESPEPASWHDESGSPAYLSDLQLVDGSRSINVGKPSELARLLFGSGRTASSIQLAGFGAMRNDEAVEVLEEVSGAFFFDFDVMYGWMLTLRRRPKRVSRQFASPSRKDPEYPKNRYTAEALALYQYGRSARDLPLLEFLAYYQAIEFFFPAFAHAAASDALRTELLNPRFDPSSDSDISRLISLSAPVVRAGTGEKEQLRATVNAATTVEGLRSAIKRIESGGSSPLTDKKGKLKGVSALHLERDDLRENLADRIYAIRCRIVHAKRDGGPRGGELLLPSSQETSSLWADVAILRYVAQQAIFSQSKRF